MFSRFKKATKNSRKGAVLSVELVMVLPILLFVLLAFIEFGPSRAWPPRRAWGLARQPSPARPKPA